MSVPAFADTVQITLTNNQLSQTANTLNADFTGDSMEDLIGMEPTAFRVTAAPTSNSTVVKYRATSSVSIQLPGSVYLGFAKFSVNNDSNLERTQTSNRFPNYNVTAVGGASVGGTAPGTAEGLHPVIFSDPKINDGQPTSGFLEVKTSNLPENTIQLVRLVFDDASTAAPAGVVIGGTVDESPVPAVYEAERLAREAKRAALRKKIKAKIKKFKGLLRRAVRAKDKRKIKLIRKKISKEKRRLRAV